MNKRDFIKLSALAVAGNLLPKVVTANTGKVHVYEPMVVVSRDTFGYTYFVGRVIEYGYYQDV